MFQATLPDLLECMRRHKYEVDIQHDSKQIFTILKIEKQEYPLFLRIFEESQLLQLLVFIPTQMTPATTVDVARLLHLLNKEVDMPGFGMDEMANIIFYRLMIPLHKKKVDEELFLTYLKASKHICEMFALPIEAVASGHATLNDILEKVKQSEQEKHNSL